METKIAAFQMISSYSFTRPEPILEALNLSGQGVFYQNQLMRLPTNSRLAVYGDLVATRYLCIQWVKTSLTKGIYLSISKHCSSYTQDLSNALQANGRRFAAASSRTRIWLVSGSKRVWTAA